MGSQLVKMNNITGTSSTSPRALFGDWKPANLPWSPGTVESYEKLSFDEKMFKDLYGRDPKQEENVEGLVKAGVVLNCVFGLSPPPKNMTPEECKLIVGSANILMEKDKSIGFGIGMAVNQIRMANPHCKDDCWK
ncbi:hypothetical protein YASMINEVIRUS_1055 [Yasminevirus sp. GU-2018]|uniref:Uncharacterized protein n=1 Tax=Yasminevirus sp. GU-2018 TaxID=2420051 RepID=A0A5K0UAQ2_9VIRU|nr:hypothetical protein YASMINEVIRUS_1055 [Yasminevirus sp. GU-2018]